MTRLHTTHPLVQVDTDEAGTPIRLRLDGETPGPTIRDPKAEMEAARRLTAVLDGNAVDLDPTGFHATP